MIKLSIIIPMKNEEENIKLCLSSIKACCFPDNEYEIICIDNGSSDKTADNAKKYTNNLFTIPGKSISYLRNFGAEKAQGEYLAFLDSDCIVDKYWMQNASLYFGSNILCFGSTPEIPEDATWVEKTWFLNKGLRKEVEEVEWLESMNLFVKKELFIEVGGFNEQLVTCEDVDLCYRIGAIHKIISDKRIKAVHLGEAKTLSKFFKKELWRGKSNITGLKEHKWKMSELPSIILPIFYLLIPLTCLLFYFFTGNIFLSLLLFSFFMLIPALLVAGIITFRAKKYNYLLKASVIYTVYFIARAISLVWR